MSKQVHIVTGATGGIGRALVADLVHHGPELGVKHVVLACRDKAKARRLLDKYQGREVTLEYVPLDLMSFASVRTFARTLREREYVVEALYNNAGTMPGRVIMSEDGYESATQTNFLSPALLTHLLLPLMPRGSHIVLTTSVTRRIVWLHANWQWRSQHRHSRFITYGRSKLMLTYWAAQLAESLKPRGIRVNCADPGAVSTGMIHLGHNIVDWLADRLVRPVISTPRQGSDPALKAARAPVTGRIFTRILGRTIQGRIPRRYFGSSLPSEVVQQLVKTQERPQ